MPKYPVNPHVQEIQQVDTLCQILAPIVAHVCKSLLISELDIWHTCGFVQYLIYINILLICFYTVLVHMQSMVRPVDGSVPLL